MGPRTGSDRCLSALHFEDHVWALHSQGVPSTDASPSPQPPGTLHFQGQLISPAPRCSVLAACT